jgi:hypothetical protein
LCRALAGILPKEQLQGVLDKLCADVASSMAITTQEALFRVPAAMQALSSIGRTAPDVFSQHAACVADFVLEASQAAELSCFRAIFVRWRVALVSSQRVL